VRLPPLKAMIFDAIKAAGEEGITSYGVISSVYQTRRKPSQEAIKSHIWQINDLLEETNYVIKSDRDVRGNGAHWRLAVKPKGKNVY
jgi:hypothetical protein